MPFGAVFARPLLWGGLAAGVLMLDQAGLLDDLLRDAGMSLGASAATPRHGMEEEVAAARETARKYLPRYLAQALRDPGTWETRAVLVTLRAGDAEETLWVEQFALAGGDLFEGVLTNDAQVLADHPQGTRVRFAMEQITDWSYVQDGTGYGYFTVHASLPYMSEAHAAVTRSFLHAVPLPKGW